MFRHLLHFIFSWEVYRSVLRNPNAITLLFTLGLVSYPGAMTAAHAEPLTQSQAPTLSLTKNPKPQQNPLFQDGVYLYGQSAEVDQLGQAYMVFEVQQEQLVGAFYMPRSSFDCFSGLVEGNQLALNIIDSYTQTSHQYAIRYFQSATLATVSTMGATQQISLEGFHQIQPVRDNDRRMLNICKADFQ